MALYKYDYDLPGRSPAIIETTSDDHTALQTLPVSIKKLICVFHTLSSLDLKEFTDVASTAYGRYSLNNSIC